jgi:hypothetical protein
VKDAKGHGSNAKGVVDRFLKDTSGATPINSPLVKASTELLRAPANGTDIFGDAGSHLYDLGSGNSDVQSAAERGGAAMHQAAVEDVGRARGWIDAIKAQAQRFGKNNLGLGVAIGEDNPQHLAEIVHMLQAAGLD